MVHQILLKTQDGRLKGIKVVFECKDIGEKLTLADRIWDFLSRNSVLN